MLALTQTISNAHGISMPDIEAEGFKRVRFGRAPPWRVIYQGLNIEAVCENKNCEAFRERVWTTFNPDDNRDLRCTDINLLQRISRIFCPMCKESIRQETVYAIAFWQCAYSFDWGKRIIPTYPFFITTYPFYVKCATYECSKESLDLYRSFYFVTYDQYSIDYTNKFVNYLFFHVKVYKSPFSCQSLESMPIFKEIKIDEFNIDKIPDGLSLKIKEKNRVINIGINDRFDVIQLFCCIENRDKIKCERFLLFKNCQVGFSYLSNTNRTYFDHCFKYNGVAKVDMENEHYQYYEVDVASV